MFVAWCLWTLEPITNETFRTVPDSVQRMQVLYRKSTDERSCTIDTVVKAVDDYIANAHSLLLRAELAKCNLKPTGGMDTINSVDIDFDGAHEGISAEIGGYIGEFHAASQGLGR